MPASDYFRRPCLIRGKRSCALHRAGTEVTIGALQKRPGLSGVHAMVSARGELQPYQDEEIGRNILVVEDDILVRAMIADKLREVGFIVIEAAGSDEALDVLAHRLD